MIIIKENPTVKTAGDVELAHEKISLTLQRKQTPAIGRLSHY